MKGTSLLALCATALPLYCAAHGHLTFPPSRNGGRLELGNNCSNYACLWFSNNVQILGTPTLPNSMRTVQQNVTTLPHDVFSKSPWRSPGTAPVKGSGCGVAGGDDKYYLNGGFIVGHQQGLDALNLPASEPAQVWERGKTADVAFAIRNNHGGGYSYRICPSDGHVNETCFQNHQLDFSGDTSGILFANGTRVPFKRVTTREGTFPPNSEWARNPVPSCGLCDAYDTCGGPLLKAVPGGRDSCAHTESQQECLSKTTTSGKICSWFGPKKACYDPAAYVKSPQRDWDDQANCIAKCQGSGISRTSYDPKAIGRCPRGTENFPEPIPGISGYEVVQAWSWSIADKVRVPESIRPGKYLLSWRWDCEESTQVWENCADVEIV